MIAAHLDAELLGRDPGERHRCGAPQVMTCSRWAGESVQTPDGRSVDPGTHRLRGGASPFDVGDVLKPGGGAPSWCSDTAGCRELVHVGPPIPRVQAISPWYGPCHSLKTLSRSYKINRSVAPPPDQNHDGVASDSHTTADNFDPARPRRRQLLCRVESVGGSSLAISPPRCQTLRSP